MTRKALPGRLSAVTWDQVSVIIWRAWEHIDQRWSNYASQSATWESTADLFTRKKTRETQNKAKIPQKAIDLGHRSGIKTRTRVTSSLHKRKIQSPKPIISLIVLDTLNYDFSSSSLCLSLCSMSRSGQLESVNPRWVRQSKQTKKSLKKYHYGELTT